MNELNDLEREFPGNCPTNLRKSSASISVPHIFIYNKEIRRELYHHKALRLQH